MGGDAQPRVPAGNPKGGEFASGHGTGVDDPTKRKVVKATGTWGHSHAYSQAITGEAAQMMGIDGFRVHPDESSQNRKHFQGQAHVFLKEIAGDQHGSPEPLAHGFARGIGAKVGDTLKIPTTATSGVGSYGLDSNEAYAVGNNPHSTKGHTIFVFAPGTPMAGYSKNGKEFRAEQGLWSEAIVAGHFRVTKVEKRQAYTRYQPDPLHHGRLIEHAPMIDVVHLENVGVFDPTTGGWHKRG